MFSLPIAAVLGATVVSTAFISGIFGMAGGMILLGILLMMLPVPAAMVLHGVTQMASNAYRAWLWRSHIRWRVVLRYGAGAMALAVLALLAGQYAPSRAASLILLGLTPFIGLVMPKRIAPDVARGSHGIGCGLVCTLLQLLTGVSGPILDVFFARSEFDRKIMIA